jgi:hypothetical protein
MSLLPSAAEEYDPLVGWDGYLDLWATSMPACDVERTWLTIMII